MARKVSEETKLAEHRCEKRGADYVPWILVPESNSHGLRSILPDWKNGRSVHLLSIAERDAYLIFRFMDNVEEVREQFVLDLDETMGIADELGIMHPHADRRPCRMTTDFIIDQTTGKYGQIAVSIKGGRHLSPRTKGKLAIEKLYWNRRGVPYLIVYKDQLDHVQADNIWSAVQFYDPATITDKISYAKHLVATKVIRPDLTKGLLDFDKIREEYSKGDGLVYEDIPAL